MGNVVLAFQPDLTQLKNGCDDDAARSNSVGRDHAFPRAGRREQNSGKVRGSLAKHFLGRKYRLLIGVGLQAAIWRESRV
jgi:hypothetical protein